MVRFIIDKARCADMQAVRLDTAGSNKPAAASIPAKWVFELAATSAIRLGCRIPDSGHLFFEFATVRIPGSARLIARPRKLST